MMQNRVVACMFAACLLVALPLAWSAGTGLGPESAPGVQPSADLPTGAVRPAQKRSVDGADLLMTERDRALGLQPRVPIRQLPDAHLQVSEHALSQRLIVKFKDGVQARTSRAPVQHVQSMTAAADVGGFNAVLEQFGLSTRQAMNMTTDRLRQLEMQAAKRTGRAQPDLAGIVYVEGPAAQLGQAAMVINELPIVEFVEFEGILDPEGITEDEFREAVAARVAMIRDNEAALALPVEDPQSRPITPPRAPSFDIELSIDSGPRSANELQRREPRQGEAQVIFSQIVGEGRAPWGRVHFRDVELSGSIEKGNASFVKITSLKDGDSQVLNARGMKSWRNSTGIFSGGLALVELYAWPNTGVNRIVIDRVTLGEWLGGGDVAANVCDDEDNRELTFDPDLEACSGTACVTGRLFPTMCTAFIFRDDDQFSDNKLWVLTAGHCLAGGVPEFIQFNVPLSEEDGTVNHPAFSEQFPLRPIALFDKDRIMDPCGPGGCVRDWALLKIDSDEGNPVDWFDLSDEDIYRFVPSPPTAEGQNILIRGYGNTFVTPAPLEWNSVLKDSIGPLMESDIAGMAYRADTTGGDSGAPVTLLGPNGEATNELIAIHTCGGCLHVGGENRGTSINIQDLVHARNAAVDEDVEDPLLFNTGACCIQGACFSALTPDECSDNNGFFPGFGTECGDWGCAGIGFQPLVCCLGVGDAAGGCIHSSEWGCRSLCGTITGFMIPEVWECDPDNPPEPCDEDPDCGSPTAGNCYYPNFTVGCENDVICEDVCTVDPDCCAEPGEGAWRFGGWDDVCAWHARRLWPTGSAVGPFATEHVCFQTVGDCHSENSTIGCDDPGCCLSVCMHDPLCCEPPFRWDSVCAELANEICPVFNFSGPTPDLSPTQGYLTATSYREDMASLHDIETVHPLVVTALMSDTFGIIDDDEDDLIFTPLPSSAVFTRPNIYPRFFEPLHWGDPDADFTKGGWGGEGFDLQGLWEFAESLDTGVENLTRGKTTRIGLLYPSAFVHPTDGTPSTDNAQTHEDLRGRVIYPEVDQTQIIIPQSPSGFLNGHAGTALLGIIGANPDNDMGMKGMSPDADLHFFPTVSAEEGGRFFSALANAIDMFDAGDVIIVPYAPRPVTSTFASTAASNLLFAVATDLGISTVVAAGDFQPPGATMAPQAGEVDSGVVIVGAVTPGQPFHRAGFSQYCSGAPCDPLEAVHISGWGHAVATLGYGDLFMGETNGEPDVLRSYTNRFGGWIDRFDTGTGAAAAQVGAAIANLQGVPKMFFGIPMPPIAIRGEFSGNSFPQAGFGLGSLGPPGTGNDPSWDGDFDLGADAKIVGSIIWPDPQTGTNLVTIGAMSDLPLAAEWLIIAGYFDDCVELKAVHAIRGERIKGNLFSVCQTDGVDFSIQSEPTSGNSSPSFVPPGYELAMSKVVYRANGQISDLFVVGQAESGMVSSYEVTATISPTTVQQVVGLELYDFEQGTWLFANAIVLEPGEGGPIATIPGFTFNPQRFFNSDRECLVRVWGFGFGTPPSPGGVPGAIPFEFNVDSVLLDIESFGAEQ